MRFVSSILLVFLFVSYGMIPVAAQQSSGSISGVVQDAQGAVIPAAKVVLTNQAQGATREVATNADGTFVFTPLQPSTYSVTVKVEGFKEFFQREIVLHADDKLMLPPVMLTIGAVGERITVEAAPVQLQVQSSERSGTITGTQTTEIAINGRSWTALLKTVPGVMADVNSINGQRVDQNNGTYDGVTAVDAGSNSLSVVNMNIDAVAEMKVLTNSMQAEYGKSAGGFINVITKSGTQDFHATGYWFHRHEDLNANSWRNNISGLPRQRYRFNQQGFNAGGPIYIPRKFNINKDKLFFFIGQDWLRQLSPQPLQTLTMPTMAQRQGDFSQTRDSGGNAVIIKDPSTGAPFPGNQIPKERWSQFGQSILNFYPQPNVAGQVAYNWTSQGVATSRPYEGIYRVDYNITSNWRLYGRYVRNFRESWEPYCSDYGNQCSNNLGLGLWSTTKPSYMYVFNLTTIISPTLTNEFITGTTVAHPQSHPLDKAYDRQKAGITFQELYATADPLQLIPNFSYGGVPSAPSTNFAGLPYFNTPDSHDFTDNVAKVYSRHTLKAGLFVLYNKKEQVSQSYVVPQISFGRNSSNPGDTNWAYSNALLGNFDTYVQNASFPVGHYQYSNVEWYVQDNWKVTPTLTLDYGIRFYLIPPWHETDNQVSSFNPSLYNPAQGVILYRPALAPNGSKIVINPITGETVSNVLNGAIVPGVGNIYNGIGVGGKNGYPEGLMQSRGVHYAPRFGLAWNPSGKSRTVIRTGAGVFYDQMQGNPIFNSLGNPPNFQNAQLFYGNIGNIGASQQALFPSQLSNGMSTDGHVATTYNWNVTVQRELPKNLFVDLAYVGSITRHLVVKTALNEPAFGSAWLPQNQDPSAGTPTTTGSTALPVNFLRPYQGYSNIYVQTFGGSSNFNSLQLSVTRRVGKGLQFGGAYVWSKALGTTSDINGIANPLNSRKADYGWLTFDRTQNLVFNYIYTLPRIPKGSFVDNSFGRLVLNGWEVSGMTTMNSGSPASITYSIANVSTLNQQTTGDPNWGPRVVLLGNPNLSRGDRTINQFIRTNVFAPAGRGSTGMDSTLYQVRGPGINNWDISAFKNVPYAGENRYIQLRVEMFNAFNHTQFSDFNRSIVFNSAGQITNLPPSQGGGGGTFGFGAMTSARSARIIQLAAKIYF